MNDRTAISLQETTQVNADGSPMKKQSAHERDAQSPLKKSFQPHKNLDKSRGSDLRSSMPSLTKQRQSFKGGPSDSLNQSMKPYANQQERVNDGPVMT